jgi:hypothetical protein
VPCRTTFTQYGATAVPLPVLVLTHPVQLRDWNTKPFPGVRNTPAWAEFAPSVARIITPAFAQAFVFCWLATRATIAPSPVSGWYMKLNPSAVPQMSAPAPFTVKLVVAET